jgi:hypothetical protein
VLDVRQDGAHELNQRHEEGAKGDAAEVVAEGPPQRGEDGEARRALQQR